MLNAAKNLYRWMESYTYSPYAEPMLGFLFYLEAICFFPTDPMLIMYCIERNDKAMRYATIATIGSVLGGITGYYIGYVLWELMGQQILHNKIVNYVLTPENFAYLSQKYREYDWLAILIAGFTPVPYKAATLSAGFCHLSLFPFIICSIIARGTRFFMLAGIIMWLGDGLKHLVQRYFTAVMVGMIVIIGCTFLFFR